MLSVSTDNVGIRDGQTMSYTKIRECFWCGLRQRRAYILQWRGSISADTVAEITHEF